MEKTRVPDGEKFWYVKFYNWALTTDWLYECRANRDWADEYFKRGNYFHTEEEAEAMKEVLNSVLLSGRKVYVVDYVDNTFDDGSVDHDISIWSTREKAEIEFNAAIMVAEEVVGNDRECMTRNGDFWRYDNQCGKTYEVSLLEYEVK